MDNADDLADASLGSGEPNILDDPEDDSISAERPARSQLSRHDDTCGAGRGGVQRSDGSAGGQRRRARAGPAAGAILHEGESIRVRFAR